MSPTVEIVIQKQNFNLKKREPQKSAKRGLYWAEIKKSDSLRVMINCCIGLTGLSSPSFSYWTRPCWTVIMKKILPFSPLFMITKQEKSFWSLSCGFVANNRQNTEGYDWIYPVLSKAGWHIFCVDFPFPSSLWQWLTFKMALLKAKLPKESSLSRILSCQEPV